MNKYFEYRDIIKAIGKVVNSADKSAFAMVYPICEEVAQEIDKLQPAADVVERKRGEWIPKPLYAHNNATIYECSCCNKASWWNNLNYCPNCGADMREES